MGGMTKMRQYIMLYDDVKNAKVYYYDMDEQCVYLRDDSVDRVKRNQAMVKGGKVGGILSILLLPFVGVFSCKLALIPMLVCVFVFSLLCGFLFGIYNIKGMSLYLTTLEKLVLDENEVIALYKQGKKIHLKSVMYKISFPLLGTLFILFAWIFKNSLLLIGGIVLFSFIWMIIISYRPICNLKWKLQIRKNCKV